MRFAHAMLLATGLAAGVPCTQAQQLDARFSCSAAGKDLGDPVLFADNGRIKFDGARIETFRWESTLHRDTHGNDCSIDEDDGLQGEVSRDGDSAQWRITLQDPLEARARRGYDYVHGQNCSIRIRRSGDSVSLKPSCPVLCGSRRNFSELSIDLKTGSCRYEQ